MIKVTEAHVCDPYLLQETLGCFDDLDRDVACRNIANGLGSYSLFVDGKIIACFGGVPINEKVAGIWTILGKEVKNHPIAYHKTIKKMLNLYMDQSGAHRAQTLVDADNDVALKQNKALGFEVEGLLKKMSPNGKDQYMLGLVRDV